MALNVSPSLTNYNAMNVFSGNPKVIRQLVLGGFPAFEFEPYFPHCHLGEFVRWVGLSFRGGWPVSSPCHHLVSVFLLGSKFQMGRVAAGRVVAFVKHAHRKVERSIRKKIGKSVSFPLFVFVRKLSITCFIQTSEKWPTFGHWTLFNFGPKCTRHKKRVVNLSVEPSNSRLPSGLFGNKLFNIHISLPACGDTRRAFLFSQNMGIIQSFP